MPLSCLPTPTLAMPMRSLAFVTLALVVGIAADARLLAQEPQAPAEAEIVTAPVEIDGATLFRVRGVSSLPAQERARLIAERITAVAADSAVPLESLHAVDADGITRLLAGDQPILTVVDADASLEQVGRVALATAHLIRIRQAALDYRAARTPAAFRRMAFAILAATLVLVALLAVLVWFWRWLYAFLTRRLEARIHSVEIKSFEVMRAERSGRRCERARGAPHARSSWRLALVYVGFVLAQFPQDPGAVARHGRVRARSAARHRRGLLATSRASSSWRCCSSCSVSASG